MSPARKCIVLVLASFWIIISPAYGAGNIHFGALELHPFVSVEETFSDNIYFTSTDPRHDSITSVVPGIKLIYPFRVHSLELDYHADIRSYRRYHTEDTSDQYASAKVDLRFGGVLGLALTDDYVQGHEPRSSSSTGLIEKYTTNAAKASATYQLVDRSKIQVDYGQTTWRFKTSDFRNRDENAVSGYIYYRFLPKTSAFFEYDRTHIIYVRKSPLFPDLDNDVDSFLLGLTWEVSQWSKGTIKGGSLKKHFTATGGQGDYSGWTSSIDVNHQFSSYTSLTLAGRRVVSDTNLIGTPYFITTGAYIELTHRFDIRLAVVFRGSYGEDAYPNPIPPDTTARTDRSMLGSVGLKYTMREWLEFGASYEQMERNSNLPVNDYIERSYILTASVAL